MTAEVFPSDSEQDWSDLIEAAKSGDEVAIGEICARLVEYLWLTADQNLANDLRVKVAASDLVQQTLFEATSKFQSFRGNSRIELRAWLKAILQNNLADSARRYRDSQSRNTALEIPIEAHGSINELMGFTPSASSSVRRKETDQELLCAIAQLPERQRLVIELRHGQNRSYSEIAKALRTSEPAARKLWSRGIKNLKTILSPLNGQDTSQS